MRLLAAAFVFCSLARADVRIQVTAVKQLPRWEQAERIVSQIPSLSLRTPADQWETQLLRSGEQGLGTVLNTKPGKRLGIETLKNGSGDVMVASWQPETGAQPKVSGLWLCDTDEHAWFVVRCDPAAFASAATTEAFLRRALKWQFAAPQPLSVEIRYLGAAAPAPFYGFGMPRAMERGADWRISAIRRGEEMYLVLMIGKFCFSQIYPAGGAYVPERFPPLREVVKTWSRQSLLSEVGKMWSRPMPYANNNDRDQILISAAAEKGFTRTDLEYLLMTLRAPTLLAYEKHVWAVMRALADTHQLDSNRRAIEEITLSLGRRENTLVALNPIFFILRELGAEDYSILALKCLETSTYMDPPLWYLEARGKTTDVYEKLREMNLPENSRPAQESALKKIAVRLSSPARRP